MSTVNLQSKQPVSSKAPLASFISATCKPLAMEGTVVVHKSPGHGMDSQSESNLPTPYVSAPSSPARSSNFNATPCFYSFPSSPAVGFSNQSSEFEPWATPKSLKDDFKFETSTRLESPPCKEEKQQQQQQKRHVPAMSFADELFSNGKLRPLKLPPRLQGGSNPSSHVSSPPGSRGAISCYTFHGHNFKNKDFDPFAAAIEEIRKEDAWFHQTPPRHRRARSLSPLRSLPWGCAGRERHEKEMGPAEPAWQLEWVPKSLTLEGKHNLVGPIEPRWRLVPIGPPEPNMGARTFPGPQVAPRGPTSKIVRRWGSLVRWSRRKINRDHRIRSTSDRWTYAGDKVRDQAAGHKARDHVAAAKDELRSPSFSMVDQAHYEVGGVEHEGVEMKTLTKYKPNNVLLCFGFSSRGMK